MKYIKDGLYPISEQKIRSDNPNTSFPRPMTAEHAADFGYTLVHPTTYSHNPETEIVFEGTPVFVNGKWEQTWVINPKWNSLDNAKIELKQRVTTVRNSVETGGTTIGGMAVATDAASQAKLTGALSFVGRNPNRAIKWKTSDEQFISLNRAQIEGLSDGVGEFVASCFDAEAAHYAAINALTSIAAAQAYDINTGWPV